MSRAAESPYRSKVASIVRPLDTRLFSGLRVLLYHRVCDPQGDVYGDPKLVSAAPAEFDAQMRYVSRHYVPVTASAAVAAVRGDHRLPRGAVLVTFDDGYRDFLIDAWPVLKRYGVPTIVFMDTTHPGAPAGFWWDELHELVFRTAEPAANVSGLGLLALRTQDQRRRAVRALNHRLKRLPGSGLRAALDELRAILGHPAIQTPPLLDWHEVRSLAAEGVEIGLHGETHAALPTLSAEALRAEIAAADRRLREVVRTVTPLYAYPFGMVDGRAVPTLRALGYVGAFTAAPGFNFPGRDDPFYMSRSAVSPRISAGKFQLSLTAAYATARKYWRVWSMARRPATSTP